MNDILTEPRVGQAFSPSHVLTPTTIMTWTYGTDARNMQWPINPGTKVMVSEISERYDSKYLKLFVEGWDPFRVTLAEFRATFQVHR